MADDLNSAIRQIAQMLGVGQGNAATGAQGSMDPPPASPDPPVQSGMPVQAFQPQASPGMGANLDILAKARDMINSMNNVSDSRINLLGSIHPFLSPTRQASCATCMQLLKIIAVLGAIPGNRGTGQKG